ncbi:hypothetical protein OOU_Y34scaffold00492g57 [Pyricularia oryzae Y34]|uniref:Uncharacterized protein n=1 Tax=Pyricularia oryzae (strain Y34) TaxID=1143189 RepID=A0AA97PMA1_PYRO3|nr:hypothetical protein OOU_Y34scaffold00492g57 [Pyricularia oryzae Y34]
MFPSIKWSTNWKSTTELLGPSPESPGMWACTTNVGREVVQGGRVQHCVVHKDLWGSEAHSTSNDNQALTHTVEFPFFIRLRSTTLCPIEIKTAMEVLAPEPARRLAAILSSDSPSTARDWVSESSSPPPRPRPRSQPPPGPRHRLGEETTCLRARHPFGKGTAGLLDRGIGRGGGGGDGVCLLEGLGPDVLLRVIVVLGHMAGGLASDFAAAAVVKDRNLPSYATQVTSAAAGIGSSGVLWAPHPLGEGTAGPQTRHPLDKGKPGMLGRGGSGGGWGCRRRGGAFLRAFARLGGR